MTPDEEQRYEQECMRNTHYKYLLNSVKHNKIFCLEKDEKCSICGNSNSDIDM